MQLSVESLIKAHLSTAYIDASGDGTVNTYAKDYAACMLPPEEFRNITEENGSMLVDEEEGKLLAITNHMKTFRATVDERELDRCVQRTLTSVETTKEVSNQRQSTHEKHKMEEDTLVEEAFRRRNDSELDANRFVLLSRPTEESLTRVKEHTVRERHDRLAALAKESRETQRQAQEHALYLEKKLQTSHQRSHAAELKRMQEREALDIQHKAWNEYQQLIGERQKATELAIAQDKQRSDAEAQMALWTTCRDSILLKDQVLLEERMTIVKGTTATAVSESIARALEHYEALKDIQHHLNERSKTINVATVSGRAPHCIALLIDAARDVTDHDRVHTLHAVLSAAVDV